MTRENDIGSSGVAKDERKDLSLLGLPAELILQILSFLEPFDLVCTAQTCHQLYVQSYDDQLWHPIVNSNLHKPLSSPSPAQSFRELYISHHPHWFLVKHRLWFGDSIPSGKLIVTRYDEQSGCIVAHTVVATRGTHTLSFWEKDRDVIIHSFEPKVSLNLDHPVLKLGIDSPKSTDSENEYPSDRGYGPASLYSKETVMDTFLEAGLYSSLMLCRSLPTTAITESTAVWPPLRFPGASRTRSESGDGFSSTGHRPTKHSEVSQNNFRLRKWVEYTGRRSRPNLMSFTSGSGLSAALGIGMPYFASGAGTSAGGMSLRMPEDITTYATLPEWCYTPTPQKPWQGIWCGDYSGHGCEFLVITQPDKQDERPLPSGMDWLRNWFRGGRRGSASTDASYVTAVEEQDAAVHETWPNHELNMIQRNLEREDRRVVEGFIERPYERTVRDVTDYDDVPSGRIEAIKLTGDPNIPRGEYTFIAPDIGHTGFVRVADEKAFAGARVVRSAGHVAGRRFVHDQYTPSQLIMISHDRLAQFWEGFGHISYYQRVDLQALMDYKQQ